MYIWKTYPGILHRDHNQPYYVPSLPKPEKSGVQTVAGDADKLLTINRVDW